MLPYVYHVRGLSLHRIPKCACTSTRHGVLEALGVREVLNDGQLRPEHPELVVSSPDKGPMGYKAAFMRDPVDRLVSCWRSKINHPGPRYHGGLVTETTPFYHEMPWEAFLEALPDVVENNHHTLPQVAFLSDDMDFIGRVENFNEDWNALRFRFKWLPPPPRKGAAVAPRPTVTDAHRELIEWLYADDYDYLQHLVLSSVPNGAAKQA